jgi:hypothetical protein
MTQQSPRGTSDLEQCLEAKEDLREENAQLRDAAAAFGALAERLNQELREDRRRHLQPDRRATRRETGDRRRVLTAVP